MTHPPQDRPDYPWGPGSTPPGGPHPAQPAPPQPRYGEATPPPAAPDQTLAHPGAPDQTLAHPGAPHQSPAQQPAPHGYAGTPPPPRPGSQPAQGSYTGGAPQGRDGDRPGAPTSAIVLLILSAVALLVFVWLLVGIVYAVPVALAVVSMVKAPTDPRGARTLAKAGWWTFAGITVLGIALAVLGIALFASLVDGSSGSDSPFDASSVAFSHVVALTR